MKVIVVVCLFIISSIPWSLQSQISINNEGTSADSSAILDVNSDSRGLLIPRLTNNQRDSITNPATGLMIFNIQENYLQIYNDSIWEYIELNPCTPQNPAYIIGEQYPGCFESGIIYSINAVPWASSYHWTVPPGALVTSGQGTTTISIEFGDQDGWVSVRAESGCGNSDYTSKYILFIVPSQPYQIYGNALPDTSSTETYYINSVQGASSYLWTVPPGATISGPQTDTSITVTFGTQSGNITVWSVNGCGISDSTVLPITLFNCGNPFTDSRDGKTYNTVQIGSQCWMSENMNIGTRIDVGTTMHPDGIFDKYCYNNVEDSCDIYGGFYSWDEVMFEEGGVCPQGWRNPSNADWCTLAQYVDSTVICNDGALGTDAGDKLKSISGWFNNGNGSDAFGFNALAAGFVDVASVEHGRFARYWASEEYYYPYSFYWDMHYSTDLIYRGVDNRDFGFSVRCVSD